MLLHIAICEGSIDNKVLVQKAVYCMCKILQTFRQKDEKGVKHIARYSL